MKRVIKKKGFTLIELIVVMAVIGILVLLAAPRFLGKTEEAQLTKHINNAKVMEDAAERYYIDHGKWPRGEEEPYTPEEVAEYAARIKDVTGQDITLEEGNYWDLDYGAMAKYAKLPVEDERANYILRNPVGKIYYLEDLTEGGKNRSNQEFQEANKPVAVIGASSHSGTLSDGFIVGVPIDWSYSTSTTPDGSEITEIEWSNKEDVYNESGTATIGLRVKNNYGIWSEWVYQDVKVTSALLRVNNGSVSSANGSLSGTITWEGDLSGKTVSITSNAEYRAGGGTNYMVYDFKDSEGNILLTRSGGKTGGGISSFNAQVPAGTTSISYRYSQIYGTGNRRGYFVSIEVRD